MPKLIIKHELPPPSVEERVTGILQIILPIIVIVIGIAAAVSLYVPASDSPVAVMPVEVAPVGIKPVPMDAVATEQVEKPVANTAVAEPPADTPAAEVKLPPGVCPLFGPGAQECKAGKH